MNSSVNSRTGPGMLTLVLGGILTIRLVSLWFNNSELFFDEAQYWYWAQDLEFGYFSKPPLLAWTIAGITSLCGTQSEFCVRLAAPLLHVGTAVLVYLTAATLFDQRTGFWSGVLYALMPAVSLSSTIISTDVPLLFCWSVALFAYVRLWEDRTWKWALLLGLAVGLGLNAKYAMAYFAGCALIHALAEQQEYTPARKPAFWLAVVLAALMLVPNVLWNLENSFVTVSHTGENIGWEGFKANWSGLGEFFGSQFGVFGPILFFIFIMASGRSFASDLPREHRFLLCFSLPILTVILFQAVISKAYANWAAATYLAATILVADILVNRVNWVWMRANLVLHGAVFLAISAAVCFAAKGQLPLPEGVEPFKRNQGAFQIATETANMLDSDEYEVLLTTNRKLSALMNYNLRDRPEMMLAWRASGVPRDHYQLVAAFQDNPNEPVLVLSKEPIAPAFEPYFDKVTELGSRQIDAGEIKTVHFLRLEGFRAAN